MDKLASLFNKTKKVLTSDNSKSSGHKFKSASFAIILGLMIGTIPILMNGGNFINGYIDLFKGPFSTFSIKTTVMSMSIFMLVGAGIGVSFKAGLFNIGAAGQMILAGGFTTMMGINVTMDKSISIPLMILIAAIVGAIAAGIAGALKAFFNVHEVVSTILLNWVFFFFIKFLFELDAFARVGPGSKSVNDSMKFSLANTSNDPYFLLVFVVIILIGLFLFFKYTTFGYQLISTGMNKDASKYAGMNTKVIMIASMSISGAFAGVAGFIFYNSVNGQMPELGDSLHTEGFEAITVTLLSFSSPIGSIPAGMFYAIMTSGTAGASASANVPKETMDLVVALIILTASLTPVLIFISPIKQFKLWLFKRRHPDIVKNSIETKTKILELKQIYNNELNKNMLELRREKLEYSTILKTTKLSNPTDYEQIVKDTIFKLNNKSLMIKYLQSEWVDEIDKINNSFADENSSIIKRDIKIKETNFMYKEKIEKIDLTSSKKIKENYSSEVNGLKNLLSLFVLDKLSEANTAKIKEVN